MGLLEQYNIDMDEYEANEGGFTQPDPGWYEFQVADIRVYEKEDGSWSGIFVDYLITSEELGVAGEEYSEIFGLPKHNPPTKQERAALERYKARIISLGFEPEEVNEVDGETARGITGTFELEASRGKDGKKYVNARHLTVDGAEEADEPEADEEPPQVETKPVRKTAATKPVAKAAPAKGNSRFQRG